MYKPSEEHWILCSNPLHRSLFAVSAGTDAHANGYDRIGSVLGRVPLDDTHKLLRRHRIMQNAMPGRDRPCFRLLSFPLAPLAIECPWSCRRAEKNVQTVVGVEAWYLALPHEYVPVLAMFVPCHWDQIRKTALFSTKPERLCSFACSRCFGTTLLVSETWSAIDEISCQRLVQMLHGDLFFWLPMQPSSATVGMW